MSTNQNILKKIFALEIGNGKLKVSKLLVNNSFRINIILRLKTVIIIATYII